MQKRLFSTCCMVLTTCYPYRAHCALQTRRRAHGFITASSGQKERTNKTKGEEDSEHEVVYSDSDSDSASVSEEENEEERSSKTKEKNKKKQTDNKKKKKTKQQTTIAIWSADKVKSGTQKQRKIMFSDRWRKLVRPYPQTEEVRWAVCLDRVYDQIRAVLSTPCPRFKVEMQ